MQLTLLHGYPDYVGKRFIFCGYGTGPVSLPAGGDVVAFPRYGNYIDILFNAMSTDGLYSVTAIPSNFGPRAVWRLSYKFQTTGGVASATQTGAGTGQTPGTYIVNATGGGGTGAQISVPVLTATTTGPITVVNPGSGYTSVPTFTLASGGTPATITAVLSAAGGVVAAGANLSGSTVQLGGFGGVY